ncbi:MAG TPA: hypothetical protein DDY49_14775 [Paenibacillaceae bacterium]|nr:hypothetical protein [Paenibacillaceae bacterium]
MQEIVAFFLPMCIMLFGTIFYSIYCIRKGTTFVQGIMRVLLLDLILFFIAWIWWFIYIPDGLAAIIGVGYYALAFVIVGIINFVILYTGIKLTHR